MKDEKYHKPVMVNEILRELGAPLKDKKFIDATVGTGGHTQALLAAGAEVLGIEADGEMLKIARQRLGSQVKLVQGNFRNLDRIAGKNGFEQVEGILFDLGVSNLQLLNDSRGFSFAHPESELDLRIDKESQGVKGSDLLNALRPAQLEGLFAETTDGSSARWLTKRVVEVRAGASIKTVGDFLTICQGLRAKPRLNPATLPFLALRIAVNNELDNLVEALPKAFSLLAKGGKILVITFHSKEEKIVRDFAKTLTGPIKPSREEVEVNPRSRSAELFVLEKK
jgi:16S rRNA (cytosine1402-N4)-methyltransferase